MWSGRSDAAPELPLFVVWKSKRNAGHRELLTVRFRAYIHINVTIFHYLIHMEISSNQSKFQLRRERLLLSPCILHYSRLNDFVFTICKINPVLKREGVSRQQEASSSIIFPTLQVLDWSWRYFFPSKNKKKMGKKIVGLADPFAVETGQRATHFR